MSRKKSKKEIIKEEEEKIDLMGQESETKAAKWVKEFHKEEEKKDAEVQAKELEQLTDKRKRPKIFSYKEHLAIRLAELLREESFPDGYHWKVEVLPKGVGMLLFSRDGKFSRRRKFSICGDPRIDINAVFMFAYWGGDEVLRDYRRRREGKKTSSGIYLPN